MRSLNDVTFSSRCLEQRVAPLWILPVCSRLRSYIHWSLPWGSDVKQMLCQAPAIDHPDRPGFLPLHRIGSVSLQYPLGRISLEERHHATFGMKLQKPHERVWEVTHLHTNLQSVPSRPQIPRFSLLGGDFAERRDTLRRNLKQAWDVQSTRPSLYVHVCTQAIGV